MHDSAVAINMNRARKLILWHLSQGAAVSASPNEDSTYLIEWWYEDVPEL